MSSIHLTQIHILDLREFMNKIKILNEDVANKIAAGEVIERPASIVKELVENSLDAGALKITIIIEKGGKELIQVIDNGCGMNENDALLAFERHATSKIRSVEDIFQISTLGFRGEAIPSIASVSDFTLITKENTQDTATLITFNYGKLMDVSKTSGNDGTSITVKKLFHNLPARRKFLKTDQIEFKHILKYIHYQSLVFPHVHFRLINEGKERLNYPAVDSRYKRLIEIFGSNFDKKHFVEINKSQINIEIHGYIQGLNDFQSDLEDWKYLFINGRYIQDKTVFHSIKTAYEPFLRKYRHFSQGILPSYLLFINIAPELVDFNVHPAKLELRFRDTQLVYNTLKNLITVSLMENDKQEFQDKLPDLSQLYPSRPSISTDLSAQTSQTRPTGLTSPTLLTNQNIRTGQTSQTDPTKQIRPTGLTSPQLLHQALDSLYQPDFFVETKPQPLNYKKDEIFVRSEEDILNPWQLHNSYILLQTEDGLLAIDQHAAHERVIYEKILHRIHGAPAVTQKLLFPLVIDIPPYIKKEIMDLIEEKLDILNKIGFFIKTFSGNSVIVDEIPAELDEWEGGAVFIDILKQLEQELSATNDFRDSISKSVACKAAIKINKPMSKKEMVSLVRDLFACEVPYFCPHGRPLIIKITLEEFEKKFKRI